MIKCFAVLLEQKQKMKRGHSFFLLVVAISSALSIVICEECSSFDLCNTNNIDAFRTCSCEDDCYMYGTCCSDAANVSMSYNSEFQCYDYSTATPVFAKTTCVDDFTGDVRHRESCVNAATNKRDLISNLLVTSSKTKTTYWNIDCAICNNEDGRYIRPWTIQVLCPSTYTSMNDILMPITQEDVWSNLTFQRERSKWGVYIMDEFIHCDIRLHQPSGYIGQLRYCAPNLISSCPNNYEDMESARRCLAYHGERKLKNTNSYFKNVYCALCHGVSQKELDCVGRNYAPRRLETNQNVVKVILKEWKWFEVIGSEKYQCRLGFRVDSFSPYCSPLESVVEKNSAGINFFKIFMLTICVVISLAIF